jgi:tetratricopeptide (TPR) repeat protein
LNHAYQLRREYGELSNQISDLYWLGRLRLAQDQVQAALSYTQQAVNQLDALPTDFHIWELPEVLFGHAQALQANGKADEAAFYIQRAYGELMLFANQIDGPSVRQSFFDLPPNAQIIQAWEALGK